MLVASTQLQQLFLQLDHYGAGYVNKRDLVRALHQDYELCEALGLPSISRGKFEEIFLVNESTDEQLTWAEFGQVFERQTGIQVDEQEYGESTDEQLTSVEFGQVFERQTEIQERHEQEYGIMSSHNKRTQKKVIINGQRMKQLQMQLLFDRFKFSVLQRLSLSFHCWMDFVAVISEVTANAEAEASKNGLLDVQKKHDETMRIAALEQETAQLHQLALHEENNRLSVKLEKVNSEVLNLDHQLKLQEAVVAKLTSSMEQKAVQIKLLSDTTANLKQSYRGRYAIERIARAVTKVVARFFRVWLVATVSSRIATVVNESEQMRLQIAKDRQEKAGRQMQYCLNKIVNAKYVQAWDRWLSVHEALLRAGRIMLRTMCRFTNGMQVGGWERWVEVIGAEKHAAAVMQRCLRRMDNAFTGKALQQWRSGIYKEGVAAAAACRKHDASALAAARTQAHLSSQGMLSVQQRAADLEAAAVARERAHGLKLERALAAQQQELSKRLEAALRAKQEDHVAMLKRALQQDTMSRAEQLAAMQLEHQAALDRASQASSAERASLRKERNEREALVSKLQLEKVEAAAAWAADQTRLNRVVAQQQRELVEREEEYRLAMLVKEGQDKLKYAMEEEQQQAVALGAEKEARRQHEAANKQLAELRRELAAEQSSKQTLLQSVLRQTQELEQQQAKLLEQERSRMAQELERERQQKDREMQQERTEQARVVEAVQQKFVAENADLLQRQQELAQRQQLELDAERRKTHNILVQQQMLVLAHQEHEQKALARDEEQQQQFHDLLAVQRQQRETAESAARIRQNEVDALRASKSSGTSELLAMNGQLRLAQRQLDEERQLRHQHQHQQQRHSPSDHQHLEELMMLESKQPSPLSMASDADQYRSQVARKVIAHQNERASPQRSLPLQRVLLEVPPPQLATRSPVRSPPLSQSTRA
jgi:hypothetical protein